ARDTPARRATSSRVGLGSFTRGTLALPWGQHAGAGDTGVPECTRLGGALLRLVVDVDDAEPLVVAVRPLEVVQERPHEVAAHVDALLDRGVDRTQVGIDERETLRIVDRSVRADEVVVRRPVLGDV